MIRSAQREVLDAIVVGAGMVGAATALALARAGLKVALVERHPHAPPQSSDPVELRVVAIAPHAQRLLASLGVWSSGSGAPGFAPRLAAALRGFAGAFGTGLAMGALGVSVI